MSIQRFRHHGGHGDSWCISEHVNGELVLYADHVAALAEVTGRSDEAIYNDGYAAGVQAARDAVAALWGNCYYECKDEALAAIDALRGDA